MLSVPLPEKNVSILSAPQLDRLIIKWIAQYGSDLQGYKRPFLSRRVSTRIGLLQLNDLAQYGRYVESDPNEPARLLQSLLINCTSFFRDPLLWTHLTATVIPNLIASKGPDEPIRIWSPGCSSGEETYSLAMVLADALGSVGFCKRVRFYATDLDEQSLRKARGGLYDAQELQPVPNGLLDKYFSRQHDGYHFRKDLRAAIVFARHDLLKDAPFHRVDLIMCRNTFIYFDLETQIRLLAHFHRALQGQGYLVLGQSESPVRSPAFVAFTKADRLVHVYSKALS
jgi:two-component system CheB/CheR fusion protein